MSKMKYLSINGLDQKCSNLAMGSMIFNPNNMDLVEDLLDTFLEHGGNTIDTAFVYGGGESEKAIGLWLEKRKKRDDVVIITKGAHHDAQGDRVNPEAIKHDLQISLERLRTDYIDIYMLHRDDIKMPVSVIMDSLNEHKASGQIKVIGVSNWTNQRIEEANAYADSKGLSRIEVNSPNLSLAKPNEPRWPNCVSVDMDSLAWHQKNKFPLFSWSSQAGGFFTGRFSPDKTDDAEMVRVYYNNDNWERLRRAEQLAKEKGTTAIQIALAYVLNQPFPACALIGPQNKSELLSSMEALDIELTAEEVRWLDLKA